MEEMNLGKYFREVRSKENKTLFQVSVSTGIDSPILSKIERGERLPTNEQLKRLSDFFEVPEEKLKVKLTAERILKEFGLNKVTLDAISIVKAEIEKYLKLKK